MYAALPRWEQRRKLGARAGWLYFLTLLLEVPGIVLRFIFLWFFAPLLLFPVYLLLGFCLIAVMAISSDRSIVDLFSLSGFGVVHWVIVSVLALANPVVSILTAWGLNLGMTGRWLSRFAIGARPPSRREREKVIEAFRHIEEVAPFKIIAPRNWFVIDSPLYNAWEIGETIYLTRELINSDHLIPLLAHELGHLNSADGKLTLALRRLVLPHIYLMKQTIGGQIAPGMLAKSEDTDEEENSRSNMLVGITLAIVLSFLGIAGGGLGLLLLNPFWVWHWRDREYYADNFAARCGLGPALVAYLEQYHFFDTATPFFMSSHPYTELRIDRLLAFEEAVEEGEVTLGEAEPETKAKVQTARPQRATRQNPFTWLTERLGVSEPVLLAIIYLFPAAIAGFIGIFSGMDFFTSKSVFDAIPGVFGCTVSLVCLGVVVYYLSKASG